MRYKNLTNERKEYIDNITEKLRCDYSSNSQINFQELAKDHDIALLKTNKIVAEVAVRKNGKDYVFIGNHLIPYIEEFETAHGIGHRILKHSCAVPIKIKEDEANYFAEKLAGINKNKKKYVASSIFNAFYDILMHPLKSSKYAMHLVKKDIEKIIDELEANKINGGRK